MTGDGQQNLAAFGAGATLADELRAVVCDGDSEKM